MNIKIIALLSLAGILIYSCGAKESASSSENQEPTTPVTVTTPEIASMQDEITLNATSVYILKTDITSTINGYIVESDIQLGDKVNKGEVLFRLQTKEAKSLGNEVNKLDPSFHFTGINNIVCPTRGYVIMSNHQQGDYVQEGQVLATISDEKSFGFVLNLPYELNGILGDNKEINICLSDGKKLTGIVNKIMPELDSVSQTQRVFLKIKQHVNLPENLVAKAILVKSRMNKAIILPKQAILSDEDQSTFWVMKLINDSTAIKVNIKKGIERDNRVQITEPLFTEKDRIIITGNYGLADTAKVAVQKTNIQLQ
ncbi:efflux RND transporter periplasmic adaptor subunit [Bacteroides sedimenti]|uniref:Multidrug resistance protein MdtA-like barrel-sandwich hybrid domain-containing protein n=1 Tax=Bacteroides sedimenti TaxID=2136147 RepID=A0ABM8IGK7_9BACE